MSGTEAGNPKKWASVEQLLAESVEDLRLVMTERLLKPSNLNSMKRLSTSTPVVFDTALTNDEEDDFLDDETPETPEPEVIHQTEDEEDILLVPTKNKARQKKFERHFQIKDDVIEYYACALALDIFLQGYLYITKNHLGFYSNVFGRVTKILIPIVTIKDITKSNTAFIFPNAIHVTTDTKKHMFGSFMARDTAYTLMNRVLVCKSNSELTKSNDTEDVLDGPIRTRGVKRREERIRRAKEFQWRVDLSSDSDPDQVVGQRVRFRTDVRGEQVGKIPRIQDPADQEDTSVPSGSVNPNSANSAHNTAVNRGGWMILNTKRDKNLLRVCYVLIVLLSISAIHLYIRIDAVLQDVSDFDSGDPAAPQEEEVLFHAQNALHARSALNILERINNNIRNISAVHDILEQFGQQYGGRVEETNA